MKKILLFLFVFAVLLITSSFPQSGQWQWLHQKPQGNLIKWVKVWDANNWYAAGYGGVFMKTSNAGISWTVNQNASKVVTASLTPSNINAAWFFDQNTGFVVGDNSTVELTMDGGTTFNPVTVPAGVASPPTTYFGIFFMDRNHGWIGGSGGNTSRFIQTTDGGITWTANAALGSTTYNDIWSPDGQIIVLATPSGNIIRSTNGGTSWTTISTGAPGSFYKLSFSNSTTGMAVGGLSGGGSPSVAVTTNAGLTWTNVVPAAITSVNSLRDVDYSGGSFYITGVHSPTNIIYKTSDLGVTWDTLQYIAPGQTYVNKYYSCDINSGVILVGGTDGLLNSVIGSTKTCYTTNLKQGDNNDIWGNASGRIIAVGAATTGTALDQIMLSINGGNTWSFLTSTGITNATVLNSLKMVDDNIGYTCSKSGGVYKTTDGGNTWTTLTTGIPTTQNLAKVDFISATTGWVFSKSGDPGGNSTAAIWKTTDGGLSWARQSYDDGGNWSYIYLSSACMVDANYGWVLPSSGGPWKTTDGGATWTQQSLGSSWFGNNYNIKMIDNLTGYVSGSQGNLFKTTNGGATWNSLTNPIQGSNAAIRAMYWKNANVGIVSAAGSALLTTDGGLTWSYKLTGAAASNYSLFLYDGASGTSALIAASEGGVYSFANMYTSPVTFHLTAFLEGYTNIGGTAMNFAPSVTVELHNSTAPYALVDSKTGTLSTAGVGTFNFTSAVDGTPYYIAVKTWNTVETWSATAQSFTSGALSYDFTTAQTSAYLSNMKQAGTGTLWCIYSGDVNQDSYVNLGDYNLVNNDSYNQVTGVVVTDLTGDQFTNLADYNIVNNNSYNQVKAHTPLVNPLAGSVTKPNN